MTANSSRKQKISTRRRQAGSSIAVITFVLAGIVLLASAAASQAQNNATGQAAPNGASSARTAEIPAGTRMRVRMIDAVDSDANNAHDRFRGVLETDLMSGEKRVAPQGTTVYGRLLRAQSAGSRAGGELELDITEILIDGKLHSLVTTSKQKQGEDGSSVARPAAKGAGAGGVAGAILGAGAGFGARAGAVIGGISGARARGEKVKVPAGAIIDFTLDHPVTLPIVER
jgi:hypothetical protein